LAGVDLEPYLRLAASLHHVAAGAVALRADLRELADELFSSGAAAREKAQKAASERLLDDRIDLVRDLVPRLREEPQRQGDYGESIGVLARTSAEVGTEAANLLREFNASLVRPALPIRLVVNVKMPTPVMVDRAVFTGIVALPGRCPALCAHAADAREGRGSAASAASACAAGTPEIRPIIWRSAKSHRPAARGQGVGIAGLTMEVLPVGSRRAWLPTAGWCWLYWHRRPRRTDCKLLREMLRHSRRH